ncbi:DEAD box helicase [Histoplasma capsulatum H143]|uniref:DEAD box helicase n=1 Tax=Ajellomyces capsulatus (strain H143) TaxID=544712 RepID=C6HES1_AJECH|nr:DEAD box helicase [Histoplasma capsulatum H143]
MRAGRLNPTRLPGPNITLNKDIQAYVQETRHAAAGDTWTANPELPTTNEILGIDESDGSSGSNIVDLVPNNIDGPWLSTEMYLRAHYNLLRENAVAPLRDAVAYVKGQPRMKDSLDVCIYEKVYVVGITCGDAGIAVKLTFSTARAGKNIVWEYSPRLTTGTIVALTPANDMFKSKCIVAVVAARPLDGLKKNPAEIDIFYTRAEDAEFDPQLEFVMIEARSGYYEASRHTLTALQKMAREGFPFSEYLCGLQPNIEPPEYIKLNPFIDMSAIGEEGEKVDVLNNWPPPPESLDSSQWNALRQILMKRLAIVQGAEGWVHGGDQVEPLSAWLGDRKVKFEVVYQADNFGFVEDDIDLEYEQLKELEMEQGLDEEDSEYLRGPYMSLMEQVRGHSLSAAAAEALRARYLEYDDLWKVPSRDRGGVYSIFQKLAKAAIRALFRSFAKRYEMAAENLKTGKWELNSTIIQSARVVGMTTTGLSKYRALISSVKPKIIMIEEAAEVIEAPITAACVKSLEHLILIGDHKQLQGNCAVKELEGEPFFLQVSLFERLVHNGIDFKTLTKQRRMAPEIRRILAPIYDDLEDHPSVVARPAVPGMGGVNSFFFCHDWPESSDSLLSKYNDREARMIVGFFIYLHLNGVPVQDITILTFYNGQRKKILKALRDNNILQGQYLKVSTVDSYQGEENEIVLLSLVRSNENSGNMGFLAVENRVCVALSRAKRGFYIFGNAEFLAVSNPLWWEVVQIVNCGPRRIGYRVPITCGNHQAKTYIAEPDHWSLTNGGCTLKCDQKLKCGHDCPLRCHAVSHSQVKCQQPCTELLPCGHGCVEICDCPCKCQYGECAVLNGCLRAGENSSSPTRENPVVTPTGTRTGPPRAPDAHADFVQNYQAYSNGGAKQDDARLASKELATIECENVKAPPLLLGNDAPRFDKRSLPILKENAVLPVRPTGHHPPTRQKYVQYYSPGRPSSNSPDKKV